MLTFKDPASMYNVHIDGKQKWVSHIRVQPSKMGTNQSNFPD